MPDFTERTAAEIESATLRALLKSGASPGQAQPLARAVIAAELDGISSHGMAYVPTYCEHLACGKVNAAARPTVQVSGNVVRVDADCGFAHPAIEAGMGELVRLADAGIASLSVFNSYNCGALGYHTEAIARHGLVALGFTNAPASIAPWGAKKPVFGTNPWSLAVPGSAGEAAFVIDQSSSVIAKSEVMRHKREGETIPQGWALDRDGNPTTDPDAALAGSMAPAGGYKGVGSAMLVEVFAACLTGASLGIEASPFSGTAGGPPRTGQYFIAIRPDTGSGGLFAGKVATMMQAYCSQENSRLPGSRRLAARARHREQPVRISTSVWEKVALLAG